MGKSSKGQETAASPSTADEPAAQLTGSVTAEPAPATGGGILGGISEMPAVQEHAIQAAMEDEAAKTEAVEKAVSGKVDSQGRPFDPALHEVDAATGEPRLSPSGNLRIKRGRAFSGKGAAKSTFAKPVNSAPAASTGPTSDVELESKITSTAQVTAETVFTIGMLVGGDEWEPRKDEKIGMDERATMVGAWAAYYRAHGITEIPAWVTLSMVMGSYAVPRFFMPKTKTRIQKAKEWFYGFVGRRKAKGGIRWPWQKRDHVVETATVDEANEAAERMNGEMRVDTGQRF